MRSHYHWSHHRRKKLCLWAPLGPAFEKLSPGPLLVEQVAYKAGMQSVRDTLRKADEVRST